MHKGLKGLGQFARRRKALFRLLGQQPVKDRTQPQRNLRTSLGDRRDRGKGVGPQLLGVAVVGGAWKRRLSCQQLVKRAAQAIEVGADIDRVRI